jgi:predicted fused transcriptional regulator/phosphomethylpyrimidine kinase
MTNVEFLCRILSGEFDMVEHVMKLKIELEKIKTKNDALLNIKHDDGLVQMYCEYIIKGDIEL